MISNPSRHTVQDRRSISETKNKHSTLNNNQQLLSYLDRGPVFLQPWSVRKISCLQNMRELWRKHFNERIAHSERRLMVVAFLLVTRVAYSRLTPYFRIHAVAP